MKRTYHDDRQEVWIYKKRKFSIVDLRAMPKFGAATIPTELKQAYAEIVGKDIPKPYEVADVTEKIQPLARFSSGEEALEFIQEYTDDEIYKLREDN